MNQPFEPSKEDCCNSGCNPCIFDVYEKQLKHYKAHNESGECSSSLNENAISQLEYNGFYVINNIILCREHRLILFRRVESFTNDKLVLWSPGDHFLVKYSSREYSCTRAYTPIKLELSNEEKYDFAVIVKRYNTGLVSNFLCELNVGDQTLWRGPYGHFQVNSNKYVRIIMIAQGTGIAPLFSLIKHILNDEENMTRIVLFYCCKCFNTILLRDELNAFKSFWNFKYSIHISEVTENPLLKYQEPISTQKLSINKLLELQPFSKQDQFLICGSQEFMKYYNTLLMQENVQNVVML